MTPSRLPALRYGIAAMITAISAAAMQIVLPPPPRLAAPTAGSTLGCAVALHLRAQFDAVTGIEVVSEARSAALLARLTSSALRCNADQLLPALQRCQPADAVIVISEMTGTRFGLTVHRDGGQTTLAATPPDEEGTVHLTDEVRRLTAEVGQALQLSAAAQQQLTATRIADDAVFAAYYRAQCYPEPKIVPGSKQPEYGDIRLAALRHVWHDNRLEPLLAERILINTWELKVSQRERDFYRVDWRIMAKLSLTAVLGTPSEATAYPVIPLFPGDYEEDLLLLSKPFTAAADPMDLSDDMTVDNLHQEAPASPALALDDAFGIAPLQAGPRSIPLARRIGALRALGYLTRPSALTALLEAAGHEDARAREAAAYGLGRQDDGKATAALQKLLGDGEPRVAFTAGEGLRRRGAVAGQLARARALAAAPWPHGYDALIVLAELATDEDREVLRQLLPTTRGSRRHAVVRALYRLAAELPAEHTAWLFDPDEDVLLTAAQHVRDLSAVEPRMVQLANDPWPPVSLVAQSALIGGGTQVSAIAWQHPYQRWQALAQTEPPALLEACQNLDPFTRAKALQLLAERDPARSAEPVRAALADAHAWVRLHAAVLISQRATAADSAAISAALEAAADPSVRSYLQDALARSRGEQPAPAPAAALDVAGDMNLAWNTSPGKYAATSPFQAYYSMKTRPDDYMRSAHAAGKIIFARATPIFAPGLIVLNEADRDGFWQALDDELALADLSILDGLIFGEETMKFPPDALWSCGWRLFCREAGIAVDSIDGQRERLTGEAERAWRKWAFARHIEGFNILHDYTKTKYGKLRPGLQVCTFTPAETLPNASPPELLTWKFDVGGVYDYKGDNRMAAYNLIRRYKTLWPERPVIWLSLGIGGYEMNVVRHDQKVPRAPMRDRYNRAFSDSLTAWLAGADTGWFSTWMFVKPDFKRQGMARLRGVQAWVEDLAADSDIMQRAIDWTFSGLADTALDQLNSPPPKLSGAAIEMGVEPAELEDLEDAADVEAEQREQIEEGLQARKDRFHRGFLHYRNYVYDCARIMSSLPRRQLRPLALAIRDGVNVWTTPEVKTCAPVPGQALLNEYDFLCDLDLAVTVGIDRYRYIVCHDIPAASPATVAAVTRWLRQVPGLLVVHLDLLHDAAADDWPWADAVRVERTEKPAARKDCELLVDGRRVIVEYLHESSALHVQTDRALPRIVDGDRCLVALWRAPDFKGAVLFDGAAHVSKAYLDALAGIINELHERDGIGIEISGRHALLTLVSDSLNATASSRYYRQAKGAMQVPGIDFMTGDWQPEVGGGLGSKSALTGHNYANRYVAASEHIGAVGAAVFDDARIEGDDLILANTDVVRIGSAVGSVRVTPLTGAALPVIERAEDWLLYADTEGIATFPRPGDGVVTTYVRCNRPFRVSQP